jgi:hypothetical protein
MEIRVEVVIKIQLSNLSAGKFLIRLKIYLFRNANEVYRISKVSGYSGVTSHNS